MALQFLAFSYRFIYYFRIFANVLQKLAFSYVFANLIF